MDVIYSYFSKNIPGEFWADQGADSVNGSAKRYTFLDDPSVQAGLASALESIEGMLRSRWQMLVMANRDQSEEEQHVLCFLWLLEEWLHAQQLSDKADKAHLVLCLPSIGNADRRREVINMLQQHTYQHGTSGPVIVLRAESVL